MKRVYSIITLLLVSIILLGGCGKGDKGGKKESEKKFKIPDSLLAPIASYNLTVDEYHPVKGGVMANDNIELHYPASNVARFVAVKSFGAARDAFALVTEKIGRPTSGRIVMIGAKDLDDYRFLTRKEWWYYGVIRGDTIYFEPLDIMIKRSIAKIGITQKFAQMALIRRSGGKLPIWLREAVASFIAGEEEILKAQAKEFEYRGFDLDVSPDEINQALEEARDRGATRIAFYGAFRMFKNLMEFSSMEDILKFADYLRDGDSLDNASRKAFGMSYSELIDRIRLDKS